MTPHPIPPRPRLVALDAARALAVVAMVAGHTLDALLAPAARLGPVVTTYWKARGLTAPLFMLVSGWAVTAAIGRSEARGARALAARLPRALLLLAIGLGLRWPGWDWRGLLAGARGPWTHLLAFDALHLVAVALLVLAAALAPGRPRRETALWLALLATLALALGMADPWWPAPASLPGLALWQATGGTSPFPLVPWLTYALVGGLVALDAEADPIGAPRRQALAGAALVALTCWQGVGTMPPAEPRLIAFRIGVVLLLLAALSRVPAAAARRVAPLGRLSLPVYAIHLPLVFGWSTFAGLAWRIGPRLGPAEALLVAALVLALSVALALAVRGLASGAGGLLVRLVRLVRPAARQAS